MHASLSIHRIKKLGDLHDHLALSLLKTWSGRDCFANLDGLVIA
jgi:hypothetical protein